MKEEQWDILIHLLSVFKFNQSVFIANNKNKNDNNNDDDNDNNSNDDNNNNNNKRAWDRRWSSERLSYVRLSHFAL